MWQFQMSKSAERDFGMLDKKVKQRIIDYFERRLLKSENPRCFGKALIGRLRGFWSYRVGDLLQIFKTLH